MPCNSYDRNIRRSRKVHDLACQSSDFLSGIDHRAKFRTVEVKLAEKIHVEVSCIGIEDLRS